LLETKDHTKGYAMHTIEASTSANYQSCIIASKKVRWDIDRDVIRGRTLDPSQKYLPDALSRTNRLEFLTEADQRFMSQIQGRTYANMFGLVERFINCKILEISREHWTGDQVALEALVRFSDEELKHQELFRRVEGLAAATMPEGYRFLPQPNEVATVVLSKSTWSVLALTCLIELFTLSHYVSSIERDDNLSPLFKDIFLFHWKEESQHARIDELEWISEDSKLTSEQRDRAVDDLIALVGAVDGLLQAQAASDAAFFLDACGSSFSDENRKRVEGAFLNAYRWQYIFSGVELVRFQKTLRALVSGEQHARIAEALEAIATAAS
jgi:hypothetical protein